MNSNALFATSNVRNQQKNLIEFKAGKMHLVEKMVHADTRKGLIYIYQSDDSLIHFCWKDRTTGTVDEDLIIFPDDCEFKRVPQCDSGRVFILKFKSSTRKFFFWMQDFKSDKDEEHAKRINDILNNPPTLSASRNGGSSSVGGGSGGAPDGELQNLLTNMSQSQLLQLFGNVGQVGNLSGLLGSMNRPSSSSSSRSGTSQASLRTSASTTNSTATTPSASTSSNKSGVAMSGPVTEEAIMALLTNKDFANKVKAILAVSDGRKDPSGPTILSKDFEQAARLCGEVMSSGDLNSVKEFKCNADAIQAAKDGNKEDFISSILQASVLKDEEGQQQASSSKQAEKRKTSDSDEGADKKVDSGSSESKSSNKESKDDDKAKDA